MLHVRSPEEESEEWIRGAVCILLRSKMPAHQKFCFSLEIGFLPFLVLFFHRLFSKLAKVLPSATFE